MILNVTAANEKAGTTTEFPTKSLRIWASPYRNSAALPVFSKEAEKKKSTSRILV
jgi:hypothetical protein